MPAFVNFTCQRCGTELASLVQVDAHKCLIPKPPAERDRGYLRDHEQAVSRETRSKRDRINRLRERVAQVRSSHTTGLANVLLGILDLMEDEL